MRELLCTEPQPPLQSALFAQTPRLEKRRESAKTLAEIRKLEASQRRFLISSEAMRFFSGAGFVGFSKAWTGNDVDRLSSRVSAGLRDSSDTMFISGMCPSHVYSAGLFQWRALQVLSSYHMFLSIPAHL